MSRYKKNARELNVTGRLFQVLNLLVARLKEYFKHVPGVIINSSINNIQHKGFIRAMYPDGRYAVVDVVAIGNVLEIGSGDAYESMSLYAKIGVIVDAALRYVAPPDQSTVVT